MNAPINTTICNNRLVVDHLESDDQITQEADKKLPPRDFPPICRLIFFAV
jgi:hypothetical protein